MHELGIVLNVIEQIEKVAEENKVEKVLKLTLEVGEVSTVVPSLFIDCFNWSIKKTKYMKECKLNLVVLEAISYCENCQRTYKTTKYAKKCPHCGSYHTYLVTGNEIQIKDIQVV